MQLLHKTRVCFVTFLYIICTFLLSGTCFAQMHVYEGTTADPFTIAWGPLDPNKSYCDENDCELDWKAEIGGVIDESGDKYLIGMQDIDIDQYTFKPTIVGTVIMRVRVCTGDNECSDWTISSNPDYATYNGNPMGWVLSIEKAPPTDIIINEMLDRWRMYKYGSYQEKNHKLDRPGRFDNCGLQALFRTRERGFELPVSVSYRG